LFINAQIIADNNTHIIEFKSIILNPFTDKKCQLVGFLPALVEYIINTPVIETTLYSGIDKKNFREGKFMSPELILLK